MTPVYTQAYIISARRTAIGRVGGLHRHRRVDELGAQAIEAALADARIEAGDVDELILGNASEGGNPARLTALAAGLRDTASAVTIDRQCASGLDAILTAIRLVASGEAGIVAAAGAEALTLAPWRLARPRNPLQLPRFLDPDSGPHTADIAAAEVLAGGAAISRTRQDAYAAAARKAGSGTADPGIAGFAKAAAENRDEATQFAEDAAELAPYQDDSGTLTAANTSQPGDGAAAIIVVGQAAYDRLQRPPALRLLASATIGAKPGCEAAAPLEAVRQLRRRAPDHDPLLASAVELNETSAAQAIAFRDVLDLPAARLNAHGGMLASGRPFGAASAVLLVRLFASLVRGSASGSATGLAVTGALGGQGVAALFEAVRE